MLDLDSHVTSYPFPPDVPEFSSRVASEAPDTWEQNMQSLLSWAAKTPIPKPWDAGLCLARCITTYTDLLRHGAHGLWNKLSRQWDLMPSRCRVSGLGHVFVELLRLLQLLQPIKEVEDFFEAKGHWQSSKQDHGLFETLCLSFPLVLRSSTPSRWHGVSRACTVGK